MAADSVSGEQKCQRANWKEHKAACVAIQQVRKWQGRDWNRFDGFWEEATIMNGLKLSGRKGRK